MKSLTNYFQKSTPSPSSLLATIPAEEVNRSTTKGRRQSFLVEKKAKRKLRSADFSEDESQDDEDIQPKVRKKRASKGNTSLDSSARTLKGVFITDCLNSSNASDTAGGRKLNESSKSNKRKPKTDESEDSDAEKPEPRAKNSLLNYFSRAERIICGQRTSIENSPINCLKQVKVVVQIHSPPKARPKSSNIRRSWKENLTPSVRIMRADVVKSFNFDDIKVVRTESSDDEKSTAKKPVTWKTEKNTAKPLETSDSDSSNTFIKNPKRLKNSELTDDSEEEDIFNKITVMNQNSTEGEKNVNRSQSKDGASFKATNKAKFKRSVSFNDLPLAAAAEKSDNPDRFSADDRSKNSDDSDASPKQVPIQPWKMRVQFASHTVKMSKSKSKEAKEAPVKSPTKNTTEKNEKILKEVSIMNIFKKTSSVKDEEKSETTLPDSEPKETQNEAATKPRKLAPLFCKQYDKKKTAPMVDGNTDARRKFLNSGLPSVILKRLEDQKNSVEEDSIKQYKFPNISHIQQKGASFVWSLPDVDSLKMKSSDDHQEIDTRSIAFSRLVSREDEGPVMVTKDEISFDFKSQVAALKKLEPDVNVSDLCSSIRRLNEEAEGGDNICWTDKYKPATFADAVGNKNNLLRLKEWIESHKRSKIRSYDGNSSSEEFVDSDDSSSSVCTKNNVAIVVGPPGCGKTCSVYMLAKELGFEVLEVSAASNRNGKRLLDELLEATQSHRVKRATISEKAEKKIKKKKKRREVDTQEKKTMSLILIEDADILFEKYDEGFTWALNSLVAQSKRPLIFVVNDINQPHLTKYNKSQNLILRFTYPPRALINAWLQLIALVEGVKLSDYVLTDLYHIAGLDLRKSLLQLQMMISSRMCFSKLNGEQLFYSEWLEIIKSCRKETLPKTLPAAEEETNDLFSPVKQNATVEVSGEDSKPSQVKFNEADRKENQDLLDERAKFLQSIALVGSFEDDQNANQILPPANDYGYDLQENYRLYELNMDICSFLKKQVFSKFEDSKSSFSFNEYYSLIRKNAKIKSVYQSTLSHFKPAPSNDYSKYCDYLPTIRTITRSEQGKQTGYMRKTSRYFSYLKSANIYVTDQEVEFLRDSLISVE